MSKMRPDRVSVLQELMNLPVHEKEALGVVSTVAEIAQQPETWKTTHDIFEQHAPTLRTFLEATGISSSLEDRPVVVLTGAGTSDYIGQVLTLLFRTEWGCETQAISSPDLLTNMADYLVPGRHYLWVSFSRSGDSTEGVTVLKQALEKFPEISHLVITCNRRARMLELVRDLPNAYSVVLDDAVNDRGLAMTSSFSNMVLFGQCLAHAWSPQTYRPIFDALVEAGESFLPVAGACAQALSAIQFKRVCVLGSGALTGVARESALKIMEMTAGRVKTMTESVLGLRHGPMAALDPETLFICFASGDQRRRQYEADLLREVGVKGIVAQRIVVAPTASGDLEGCCERLLEVDARIPDLYRPPVDVLFGQLLGLYFSLAHGLKPDAPSPGGVINRVVSNFTLYE